MNENILEQRGGEKTNITNTQGNVESCSICFKPSGSNLVKQEKNSFDLTRQFSVMRIFLLNTYNCVI